MSRKPEDRSGIPKVNIQTSATALLLACVLTACTAGMDAVVQSVRTAVQGPPSGDSARLNPKVRYLRVTISGRVVFLALGFIDSHPQGPIEVWYSADREVVRLQNGRLVGAVGLTTEWRNVVLPELPSWSTMARAQQPVQWVRMRDVMPGYRFGVRDSLVLAIIPTPQKNALQGIEPQSLTWFEERIQPEHRAEYSTRFFAEFSGEKMLPPTRYAVALRDGKETVVYGEQCVAPELCFTWQQWTVKQ
jgi:hypothetical protein